MLIVLCFSIEVKRRLATSELGMANRHFLRAWEGTLDHRRIYDEGVSDLWLETHHSESAICLDDSLLDVVSILSHDASLRDRSALQTAD
jgi:hypothetical protein